MSNVNMHTLTNKRSGAGGRCTGWPIDRAVSKLTWTVSFLHISCAVLKRQTVVGSRGKYIRGEIKWRNKMSHIGCKIHTSIVCYHIAVLLFCHFHSWSGPNDSNELGFLSHTGVTATAEISVIFILVRFPLKKNLIWGVGTVMKIS